MILCKNCKWFKEDRNDPQRYSICTSPNNKKSTTDGLPISGLADLSRLYGPCGSKARFFEIKEKNEWLNNKRLWIN